eukprot:TRINITY_DN84_c0_g1_i1.p1 TRINITY_DN84_c0_g1~~TRINITY_DN84_c0_g1_i1.p1  ORF type:complete len:181 (-),score=49.76 TRINITY_DN84_c0_g1_i1:83-625(-)
MKINNKIFKSKSSFAPLLLQTRNFNLYPGGANQEQSASNSSQQYWFNNIVPKPKELIKSLNIPPGSKVIDLGCGDGYFTNYLAENNEEVYGFDMDNELLKLARHQASNLKLKNIHYIQGDIMNFHELIPIKADFILMSHSVTGITDMKKFQQMIQSKLNPNAQDNFCIIKWNRVARKSFF